MMPTLGILQLLTLLINAALLVYVLVKFDTSRVGTAYLFIISGMTCWAFADALATLGPNIQFAHIFEKVGEIAAIFVGPSILRFVLVISYPQFIAAKQRNIFLYIPSCILSAIIAMTNTFSTGAVKSIQGYEILHTAWYPLLGVFVGLLTLISIIVSLASFAQLNELQKKQMRLFIFAFFIPLVGGTITETIAPALHIKVMPLTTALSSITALVIIYAIRKYEFLSITPSLALEQIFNTIRDALIAVNATGEIVQANSAAHSLLGYAQNELIGLSLPHILQKTDASEMTIDELTNRCEHEARMSCVKKDTTVVPVLLNSSPIIVEHTIQGIVLVARDMTTIDKLVSDLEKQKNELELSKTELEKNMHMTKQINETMVGRELKMIELKNQITKMNEAMEKAGIKVDNVS